MQCLATPQPHFLSNFTTGRGAPAIDFGKKLEKILISCYVGYRLFADYPVVMPLFDGVNGNDTSSPEFKAHSQRVLRGFDVSINLLYNPDILAEELDHLKVQHAPMGILTRYYYVSICFSSSMVSPAI